MAVETKKKLRERKAKGGVPANTNPFCMTDMALAGLTTEDDADVPVGYLRIYDPDGEPYAPVDYNGPALSQKEAERIITDIYNVDAMEGSVAVRSEYAHIIPKDMRARVRVVDSSKTLEGRCNFDDTYLLEDK